MYTDIPFIPRLAGVHHVTLPVGDPARSQAWYERVLGHHRIAEFTEGGAFAGVAMAHPGGGPVLCLRHDPALAAASAGFAWFSLGVPDLPALEALAARLDALGEPRGAVVRTTRGWLLPRLRDPTATSCASPPPTRGRRRSAGRCCASRAAGRRHRGPARPERRGPACRTPLLTSCHGRLGNPAHPHRERPGRGLGPHPHR
ncbi:VOC family protein [Actinacidiphila glaucinigra]|uniref:VOC family protein n=1 Tax=Actinacidiphila glaucinigra TaxID=235986 RepID=UPI0037BB4D96